MTSSVKLIIPAILICIGCSNQLPCKTVGAYTTPHFEQHTHLVWCKGSPEHCFDIAGTFCSGATLEGDKQHSSANGRWHQVAVGTNVPVMTKEGDGYSFWIVCDDEK